MKIEAHHSKEEKAKYKVVDLRDGADLPGEIQLADEETGECEMLVKGAVVKVSCGEHGCKILKRGR